MQLELVGFIVVEWELKLQFDLDVSACNSKTWCLLLEYAISLMQKEV